MLHNQTLCDENYFDVDNWKKLRDTAPLEFGVAESNKYFELLYNYKN